MLVNTEAIILGYINYSETSNINFLALIQNSKEEQTEEETKI